MWLYLGYLGESGCRRNSDCFVWASFGTGWRFRYRLEVGLRVQDLGFSSRGLEGLGILENRDCLF